MVFFFYDKIKNNLDRIIYHLGSQINDKYYTDFLKKENNIIFNNDMTMFNPYNPIYHSNDFYKTIINDNDKLIKFNNYLNDIVNIIVDIFVVQFEKFFVLLQNKNNNIITSDTDLFIMSHFSKTNCKKLIFQEKYYDLYYTLYTLIVNNCTRIFNIVDKPELISNIYRHLTMIYIT